VSSRRRINPYVAGAPVRGPGNFFGRRAILDWITQELGNKDVNALVLVGPRRIGKTTLLLQLEQALPREAFLPVYFDLQDQATRPMAQVLAELADTVAHAAGLPAPDPDSFDDKGLFFQRAFSRELYHALGEQSRPVFLLDEFDVMDRVSSLELPETAASRALFPFLRRTMSRDRRPAFVFAIGRRAEDLSIDFNTTFRTSLVRELWVLDRESLERLIRQAEENGSLRFTSRAVSRIVDLTSGHPYFSQLLCQRIWERAYRSNPTDAPKIGSPEVEAAVPQALEAGGQALLWIWNGMSPAEKIYAAAMAEATGRGQTLTRQQVIQDLASHAARLRTREVEQAAYDLTRRRVLEEVAQHEFRFAIELFRRWVRENRPLHSVKDELDRVEPLAEHLFRAGMDQFRRRRWEAAARHFRDALETYPQHFGARLHLGEALLELGEIEEAVVELETASSLDQAEAKYALARAVALANVSGDIPLLTVDDGQRRVYRGTHEVRLSALEFSVLRCIAQGEGELVSKDDLTRAVQRADGHESASIDAAIYRLRQKLGDSARSPTYLETIVGQGYILHNAVYIPAQEAQ
jgi:tetratricopeptide (TPR) repeat protein